MGEVYEARDRERNTRVALKTVSRIDPHRLYLFKKEFRSLADFSHPNLVSLYELFEHEGQWFFTMEYVEGCGFLDYVRTGEDLPREPGLDSITYSADQRSAVEAIDPDIEVLPGACDFARLRSSLSQLAASLRALHSSGILHRDLKPLNVMITPEGRLVVLDFGLAAQLADWRVDDGATLSGISGTIPYMSPEQAGEQPLTEATDWYAVGVMCYEALAGRRPFEGHGLRVILDKQKFPAPPLERFTKGIPEDLNAICMRLLERDPARRLTGEELLTLLPGDPSGDAREASALHNRPATRVFVGRETQLATLHTAFAAIGNNTASIVFVHGKSGIGKSALIDHFLRDIGKRGDTVILTGRCYEQESMPYKALDSVIDSLTRYLARLPIAEAAELTPRHAASLAQVFPVLLEAEAMASAHERGARETDQQEVRRRAFGALRELLARLGDRKRVVVSIDDLQWGDLDSASLLHEVLRGPEAPVMLLIGSYRDGYEGKSAFLDAMSGIARHDVPVGPLTGEEARTLVLQLLGSQPGDRAEAIVRESDGNPYFVQELADRVEEKETQAAAVVLTLDSAIYHRVNQLPDDARRLLEVVSVSGRPTGQREIYRAAEFESHDTKPLALLRARRLVRGAGGEVECYHDRVRETVVAHLDSSSLGRLHLRLALTLESAGAADAEGIAIHFEGGGEAEKASHYYVAAAQAAEATLAFKHAAGLFRRALGLSTAYGEERRQLVVKLAGALANAGLGADAGRAYREASAGAPTTELFELKRKEAYWFCVSGHMDEGRRSLESLLHEVGLKTPRPALLLFAIAFREIQLMLSGFRFDAHEESQVKPQDLKKIDAAWDAAHSFGMIYPALGVYFNARSLLMALRAGEPGRIAHALILATVAAVGVPVVGRHRVVKLTALFERLVREEGTPYIRAAFLFSTGLVATLTGEWKHGHQRFLEAESIFSTECAGVSWEFSTMRIFTLWNLMYQGRYAELRSLCVAFERDARERGDLYEAISINASIQPWGELAAGRPDEAIAMMDAALVGWPSEQYSVQLATSVYVRALVFLYRGEAKRAFDFIEGEWVALRRNLYLHVSLTRQWLRYTRAQTALAVSMSLANPGAMLRLAEQEANALDKDETTFGPPLAKLLRAGCAARRGEPAEATRRLNEAAGAFERADMTMMAAAARLRLGEVEKAEAAMRAEGVGDPAKLTAALLNGWGAKS